MKHLIPMTTTVFFGLCGTALAQECQVYSRTPGQNAQLQIVSTLGDLTGDSQRVDVPNGTVVEILETQTTTRQGQNPDISHQVELPDGTEGWMQDDDLACPESQTGHKRQGDLAYLILPEPEPLLDEDEPEEPPKKPNSRSEDEFRA